MDQGSVHAASPVRWGIEDTFSYVIGEQCVQCGACARACPVQAITKVSDRYKIDTHTCIDCGTCAAVCSKGAAAPVPLVRESLALDTIDPHQLYLNPGCAMSLYRPELTQPLLDLLKSQYADIQLHTVCCRHDPVLPAGSTIINNCAGCDRRFRSLYQGINTISLWEVLDQMEIDWPQYPGLTVSVHDSCGYRHKPQVHQAVRSLLQKMAIQIEESRFHGTSSVCCGDNFYGHVEDADVEKRIRMRASQLPADHVVVYCIGCVRAMMSVGKTVHYLPDLIMGRKTETMPDTLKAYHTKLASFIQCH